MKKLCFILLMMTALPLIGSAQSFKFAFYNEKKVLQAMPDYLSAQQGLEALRAQYEAEAKRMSEEFNNKYEEFLDVQSTLAQTIRNKRQMELEELMTRGVTFRNNSQKLLADKEVEMMAPIRLRLDEALQNLGTQYGYAFIMNADNGQLSWVNTTIGEDITELLIKELNVKN